MDSDELDLDWRSIEILQALAEAEGSVETSTLRDATAIEDNRRILYRVSNHLEPDGFVTTSQPERKGTTIPPKNIALTETGREIAQSIENTQDATSTLKNLPSLVDKLNAEVTMLTEQVTALDEHISHVDDQLAERRETDATVSNALTDLDQRLASLEERERERNGDRDGN